MKMMSGGGVLVSRITKGNATPHCCSGIHLGHGWILTTGNILSSFSDTEDKQIIWKKIFDNTAHEQLVDFRAQAFQNSQVTYTVRMSNFAKTTTSKTTNKISDINYNDMPSNITNYSILKHNESLKKNNPKYRYKNYLSMSIKPSSKTFFKTEECQADIKYGWHSQLLSEAIDTILSSWVLGNASSTEDSLDTDSEIVKYLTSFFLFLKLRTEYPVKNDCNELFTLIREFCENEIDTHMRGQMVIVESTPFGNDCFFNSISEGIISNVVGPGHCLLLSDARTAPGSEGGAIYLANRKDGFYYHHMVGMVISSISWWRGEWVGFTLGVALQPIFHEMVISSTSLSGNFKKVSGNLSPNYLDGIDDCIVLVRCGMGWGSGVVVDSEEGIILTCSHVLNKSNQNEVKVYWNNKSNDASIIYRNTNGCPYDVALIRTKPGIGFRQITFSSANPTKGEPVIAAGFPLFSEDHCVRPTVTRGIISHVSDPIAVMQTTCCIQAGASGGALFGISGEMLGLIVCNILDSNTQALYPRINMAVPGKAIMGPIKQYLRTKDVHVLSELESQDPLVLKHWKIGNVISKL